MKSSCWLNDSTVLVDAIIFGLRMNRGIDLGALMERFPGAGDLTPLASTGAV